MLLKVPVNPMTDFEETGPVMQLKHITLNRDYNKVSQYKQELEKQFVVTTKFSKQKYQESQQGCQKKWQKAKQEERLPHRKSQKGNQNHSSQFDY